MKFTPRQFIILEDLLSQAYIPFVDLGLYSNVYNAIKSARQPDDSGVEIDFSHDDLNVISELIANSSLKVKDLELVIELVELIRTSLGSTGEQS